MLDSIRSLLDWQTLAVAVIVICAAMYVGRQVVGSLFRKKSSCGACASCPASTASTAPTAKPLVEIGALRRNWPEA